MIRIRIAVGLFVNSSRRSEIYAGEGHQPRHGCRDADQQHDNDTRMATAQMQSVNDRAAPLWTRTPIFGRV